MALYFLRHGDTFSDTANKNLSVKEATRKISLSETGKAQVKMVRLPENLDIIVISDSLRTRQTAEIVLKSNNMRNVPIKVDSNLHPWDSGADDWNTYWQRYYDFVEDYSEKADYESKKSMYKRLNKVISKYSGKNVLIIAHSILLANYLGKDFLPCAELIRVD